MSNVLSELDSIPCRNEEPALAAHCQCQSFLSFFLSSARWIQILASHHVTTCAFGPCKNGSRNAKQKQSGEATSASFKRRWSRQAWFGSTLAATCSAPERRPGFGSLEVWFVCGVWSRWIGVGLSFWIQASTSSCAAYVQCWKATPCFLLPKQHTAHVSSGRDDSGNADVVLSESWQEPLFCLSIMWSFFQLQRKMLVFFILD
jgi:hypothetical protein